nr:hypothetical protein [Tanacetum cinerariifolium]
MLYQQQSNMHNQFSQILTTLGKSRTPTLKPNAPTLAITTRAGTTTRNTQYLISPSSAPADNARTTIESEKLNEGEAPTTQRPEDLESPALYHPSISSSVPFPSRLKKTKKDDEDERLLSIFRQIHINLPFLEVIIHIPKGAKVLKDLLSHKEKLEKAASLVKLSEECSTVI